VRNMSGQSRGAGLGGAQADLGRGCACRRQKIIFSCWQLTAAHRRRSGSEVLLEEGQVWEVGLAAVASWGMRSGWGWR